MAHETMAYQGGKLVSKIGKVLVETDDYKNRPFDNCYFEIDGVLVIRGDKGVVAVFPSFRSVEVEVSATRTV